MFHRFKSEHLVPGTMWKTSLTGATERRSGFSWIKTIFHQNKWDKETLTRRTTANHPSGKHHGNEISLWWNDFNLAAPGFCAGGAKTDGSIRFTFSALVRLEPVWSVDGTRKRRVRGDGVPSDQRRFYAWLFLSRFSGGQWNGPGVWY